MLDLANKRPSTTAVVLAFAAIYFIWGSTFLGIRFAIETIPPLTMAGGRFLAAGIILQVWCLVTGRWEISRANALTAGLSGFLLLVLGNGSLVWAEQFVPSGRAALLIATIPLWMILLDWIRPGGVAPSRRVGFSLILGVVGVGVLASGNSSDVEPGTAIYGTALLTFASIAWAAGSLVAKYKIPKSQSVIPIVSVQMLTGGAILLLAGAIIGEWPSITLDNLSSKSLWAFVYLILPGTVLAYAAYVWLLRVSTPSRVGTYALVNPIVAVILGWALGSEVISLDMIISGAVILLAVGIVMMPATRLQKHFERGK